MNLDFTQQQLEFRERVRDWLADNLPQDKRPNGTPEARDFDLAWQKTLYGGGWAGINWPTEYGGQGFDTFQQLIFLMEYAKSRAPGDGYRFNGLNLAGPTIIACGDEEQKKTYLPPILKGEVIWCQGFSEPAAGSDLASLKTRAVIDGDDMIVTGSKIWTSWARFADWQQLLVRTDPDAPKHGGISWVINRMDNPGMEIRPIQDMAGGSDLHEVFYDEVRIPLKNIVGGINNGWRVSMAQLAFERGTAFMPSQIETQNTIEDLIQLAKTTRLDDGRLAIDDDHIGYELAKLRAETRALLAMTLMGISRNERTSMPGPEGSMLKLFQSELYKRVTALALEILGPNHTALSGDSGRWPQSFLGSFANTLGGGTSEVMRNIIGERCLGLPK
ncbi:MAG: alkylation response protein AidB-like acyl-CoA dehydrogenase [Halioglobus sp.]|jgi:alkylation response protein AidB-like acyl-CoA dehydrogenase